MAGSRLSLSFHFAHELRELLQMATIRLEEVNFLDGAAEYRRVSAAITAAVNREPAACVVDVDVDAGVVQLDLAALTDRIGEAFTAAGVRPDFLKPVYRPEGLGWFRQTGWRVAVDSGIARAFPYEGCWATTGGVAG